MDSTETPVAADEWTHLAPAARMAFAISSAIGWAFFALFLVGGAVLVSLAREWPLHITAYVIVFVAWTILGFVRGQVRWAHTFWRLDNGLRIRRGKWWRSEVVVPRARLQHLDVSHGPIERGFGLATLTAYTAAANLSAVSLSGLDSSTATQLRDALLPAAQSEIDGV